ncbi:hypothetical protein MRX96_042050 [Rhipicephalus microplus]
MDTQTLLPLTLALPCFISLHTQHQPLQLDAAGIENSSSAHVRRATLMGLIKKHVPTRLINDLRMPPRPTKPRVSISSSPSSSPSRLLARRDERISHDEVRRAYPDVTGKLPASPKASE